MSKLVTIYGGAGFVGRYIARRMAQQGWRVRVAVRRPNEALHVKPYGAVGQVEPVFCNIRDDASVRAVMRGADAVVNCVGTFDRAGRNNFKAVQHEGAERIARIAAEEGVARMVHISAIGANETSDSQYLRTKALGEAGVQRHMPDAVILRPSVIFGFEDAFYNRFASMARFGPILPLVSASTKFQPVYVDDVAHAAEMGILGTAPGGIYELGGPEVASFRKLMGNMLKVIYRRRLIINLPLVMAALMAFSLDLLQTLSLRLFRNTILTSDQLRALQIDSVVSEDARGLADLGIKPTPSEGILPEYLWRFRPQGQYDDITASAKNLKT